MTCKPMTLISSAILALAMTGPAAAADVTGAATDAVKKKAAEEVQKQVPGAVTAPAVDPTKAVTGATPDPTKAVKGAAPVPAVDPTKAVKGAAPMPAVDPTKAVKGAVPVPAVDPTKAVKGAVPVPAVDPTKAATGTAEDMAKKKATEAAQGVVK